MATKTSQRVAIWVIAIVMTAGTIGSFIVIMLANDNQKIDQAHTAELQAKYQTMITEYQAKVSAQADELSTKYYAAFQLYSANVAAFDAASVTGLATEDLKVGDGEEIKEGTAYSAYYIGWNPTGTIFDQSIDGTKLKSPIAGGDLITGWNEGVIGMKMGGVRVLTIPSDKAYGEAGSGENIPANTPLKFIVFVIPKVETIPEPDFTSLQ